MFQSAVDLAVKMSASQITLFGADFAFPMNKTHAGWQDGDLGASFATATHWVHNGHGVRVRTLLNFRSYLCELERHITRHPQVRVFNSSREGAMIAGTTFHPEFANHLPSGYDSVPNCFAWDGMWKRCCSWSSCSSS